MAWLANVTGGNSNENLLKGLKSYGVLHNSAVINAMNQVDRGNYCSINPYSDSPQPIGYQVTISAPHIHAHALETLYPNIMAKDSKILDVGCGSGYLSACFARLNPMAKVIGIDHLEELVELSKRNVKKADKDLSESQRVSFHCADGWKGYPEEAPFDAIYVGAGAVSVPQDLLQQLKIGGKLLIPVGRGFQSLKLIERTSSGDFQESDLMGVMFVPLHQK